MLVDLKRQRKIARQQRDALRGRLGKDRFDRLAGELVSLHRLALETRAVASVFGLEGTLRAAVRADLVLQGWRWRDADLVACGVLAEVYRRLRAERPDWAEGQPEWVRLPGVLIERTRCAKCHGRLPEGHSKFCSRICATTYHDRLATIRAADEARVSKMASRWI